jgi:DNA-binding response OmpR family regulator
MWDTPGEKRVAVRVRNADGSQTQSLSLTITVAHNVLWCDDQGTFFIGDQKVVLPPNEYLYKLLKALYANIEQPVSLEQLVKTLYVGRKLVSTDSRTIQRHKCRLSDILETEYRFIEAYRGGYRLVRQGKPVTKKRNPA